MYRITSTVVVAACIAVCTALPVEKQKVHQLPVLKEHYPEVLFRHDNYSTAYLECALEGPEKDAKYTWYKNGQVFDWAKTGHIAQNPGEGSIMFFNPQPSDEGQYKCLAETSAGIASTRTITLRKVYLNAPTVKLQEHKPVEGKPYKLECKIPEAYPKPTILWKTQLIADPSITEDFLNPRITRSPDGALFFSNVTESDVSDKFKYVCLAQTPASREDVLLAEHKMVSLEKPKTPNDGELSLQYVTNDITSKVGDETMIYCIYGGTPLAYPDWFKDNKLIQAKGGDRVTDHNRTGGKRLLIKDTRYEDQGTYKCEVGNGVGKKLTHSMKLTVVGAPKLSQQHEKRILVKEGQDISIPCKVTGIPEPKVSWTYNTKAVSERAIFKDGALTIKGAKKGDTGYYGCKAENEHGDLYAETLVQVA